MGTLTFQATAGGSVNLLGPNISGTVNLTLPSADGTSGQPLQTNGSGTLSFANLAIANGGTGVTSFAANQIHYGSFSQSAGLTFDGTNFATTGTATAAKLIPTGTSVTGNGMYLPAANSVGISTAGANAVYIDASQNVGFGTSSPAGLAAKTFTVQTSGFSSVAITTGDYSSGAGSTTTLIESLGSRSDGNTTFGGRIGAAFRRTDGTAISSGQVLGYYGLGGQWGTDTSYQQAKLLYSASIVGVAEGSFTSATAMPTAIVFGTGSTGGQFQSANTAYGTERMRITSAGNVGVGTNTPSGKLTVVGQIKSASATQSALSLSNAAQTTGFLVGRSFNSTDLQDFFIYDETAAASRLTISSAGIVAMPVYGAGAATFSASGVISSVSDETWKTKDGVPVDPDAMLKKLEPGYWYYNDEKKETFGVDRHLGFYAQNVNAAIGPEAAPTPEEGKPWGYYDRSVLAVAVMSLQKALATIESLTARITALEST